MIFREVTSPSAPDGTAACSAWQRRQKPAAPGRTQEQPSPGQACTCRTVPATRGVKPVLSSETGDGERAHALPRGQRDATTACLPRFPRTHDTCGSDEARRVCLSPHHRVRYLCCVSETHSSMPLWPTAGMQAAKQSVHVGT